MRAVLYILFGASYTVATAWALGAILIRKLSLTLYRAEERLFSFILGSACLSAIMFVLASLKLVHKGVLLALSALAIGYALYSGAHRSQAQQFAPLPRVWKWTFVVVFAAFTVFYFVNAMAPEVGRDGTIAYIDVATAAIAFALFYLLQIWDEDKNAKLLVPIGMLTGFCFATKYTTFLAVPYAIAFVSWKLWRAHKPVLRPMLAVSLLALVFIAPWLVKSWILVDNPISPFGNRLLPNRYVHVSFEDDYRRFERIYGLTSRWEIPLELTVKGDKLTGFFGPLFLLTPLALLALRFREGRQLWLAAALFWVPYFRNIGTPVLLS